MKQIYFALLFFFASTLFSQKRDWKFELHGDANEFEICKKIEYAESQLESCLQVIRVPPRVYSRFPAPTDPDEKHQLLLIKIVSVSLVILLILYLLFRRRNRKTFMD